jgi:cytochrome b subunit of formate dehydrogenase
MLHWLELEALLCIVAVGLVCAIVPKKIVSRTDIPLSDLSHEATEIRPIFTVLMHLYDRGGLRIQIS